MDWPKGVKTRIITSFSILGATYFICSLLNLPIIPLVVLAVLSMLIKVKYVLQLCIIDAIFNIGIYLGIVNLEASLFSVHPFLFLYGLIIFHIIWAFLTLATIYLFRFILQKFTSLPKRIRYLRGLEQKR